MTTKLAWLTDVHFNICRDPHTARNLGKYTSRVCDVALITGDIAEADSLRRYMLEFAAGCPKPTYFLLGNHDVWGYSFAEAQDLAEAVAVEVPHLHYLPRCEPVDLGGITLVGSDGFYDARAGDAEGSDVFMNDWRRITDLRDPLFSGQLVEWLQRRGREAAESEALRLRALPSCQRLLYATHVPPFAGLPTHNSPWYTNVALGRELALFADARPGCHVTVLSGHVHEKGSLDVRGNLRALSGNAEYGAPSVCRVFDLERPIC